jgi:HK97 family phage major capsid protein
MARRYINPNLRTLPDSPENLADYFARALAARPEGYPGDIDPRAVFGFYAQAALKRDPGLRDQVRGQLAGLPAGVRAAVRGPGNALDVLYRADAPGVKLDGVFGGLGDLVATVRQGGRRGDKRLGEVARIQASFGSEVPDAGGFLVGEELRSDLVLASLESAIVRPRAINIPMGTLRTGVPAMDPVTNASAILGGFVGYWTEEGATITESTPTFQRIFLDAKALKALGNVPNELILDAPAFDVYLRRVVPAAMAWWEDQALIHGTGVGEPEGCLNAACQIKVSRATASHVKLADVQSMVTRMWPQGFATACWLASPDVLTELINLFLSVGSPTTQAVSPPGLLIFSADRNRWELLGLPLYATEHANALGTAGDFALVDLGAYLLGTRALLQVDTSPHYKFNLDVTSIRIRTRVDGRMWPQSSVTPANSSQSVGPVVTLN